MAKNSNNTLPINKFLFYLKQDHYFLEEFSKFLQSAKQKAINKQMNQWLDGLYISTVDLEMEMQRQMLRSIGPSSSRPLAASLYRHSDNITIIPCKTTLDYTAYLKHVSSFGTFSEVVSVMASCPWTYLEIAQQLSTSSIHNGVYSNSIKVLFFRRIS